MFKKPFSFEGRIRRLEYGLSFLIYLVWYVSLFLVSGQRIDPVSIFLVLLIIPLIWFLWAQGAKRCHDVEKSGWWQIIPFYFFVLLFKDGYPGRNEYGASPKFPDQGSDNLDPETLDGHLRN